MCWFILGHFRLSATQMCIHVPSACSQHGPNAKRLALGLDWVPHFPVWWMDESIVFLLESWVCINDIMLSSSSDIYAPSLRTNPHVSPALAHQAHWGPPGQAKSMGSEVRRAWVQVLLLPFYIFDHEWVASFTFLSLSFLVCKLGIIIIPVSLCYSGDQLRKIKGTHKMLNRL